MSLKPYLEWANCSLVRRTRRVPGKWEATTTFHAEDSEDLPGRTGGIGLECVCVGGVAGKEGGKRNEVLSASRCVIYRNGEKGGNYVFT